MAAHLLLIMLRLQVVERPLLARVRLTRCSLPVPSPHSFIQYPPPRPLRHPPLPFPHHTGTLPHRRGCLMTIQAACTMAPCCMRTRETRVKLECGVVVATTNFGPLLLRGSSFL